ncbi:HpcH/HpaI aldolase/citrate lyase family protein [Agromyces intestinalis]|uniref:HpcH/HpaI aldolase/citrate lyase family protein n=1 Tax=Agromyces intestinalis TaxID=2592652 RepID=A0A5C1YKT8_9MICO|nr:HpcH/HpaI aldolase/citrate lyase family protein [Agromyces intestinalis]QEO15422.1 HpcH/HpaI aldolase/citrate lyase family protein [Agromyces intestinalis]
MNPPVNEFKRRLLAGERQVGIFATMADASLVELLAARGFDWIVIDTEHAPTDPAGVLDRLRVLDAAHAEAIVRPTWNDPVLVKRLLDIGARTLLFPSIGTADAAALAVASTRYPPEGIRGVSGITRAAGYGRDRGYLRAAAAELCVIVQLETAEGLANLDAIAAVPGVDAVFIGPSDLAASMGHPGDAGHPDVQAAVDGAFARLAELGMPAGYLTLRLDEARERMRQGIAFAGVASDTSIVQLGVDALFAALEFTPLEFTPHSDRSRSTP